MADGSLISTLQNGVIAMNLVAQRILSIFPTVSGTSTSATAGAQTLPANPAGFITVTLPNGSSVKVPYYNT